MKRHSSGSSDKYNYAPFRMLDNNLPGENEVSSNDSNQSSFSTEQQPLFCADNTSECYNCHVQFRTQQTESNNGEVGGPPSFSLLVPYSDNEATSLIEKLRNEETYESSLQRLFTWLVRSEFNKSNSSRLYTLLESVESNIWRFMCNKSLFKEEFNQKKLEVSQKGKEIICQLQDICKVYRTVRLQKVWDQFTKAQRRHISTWMKEAEEIVTTFTEELDTENLEPDENSMGKSSNSSDFHEEYKWYKEELESLQNQIRFAEEENATLRNESAMIVREYQKSILEIKEQTKIVDEEIVKLKTSIAKLKKHNTASKGSASKFVTMKSHQPTNNSLEENVHQFSNKKDIFLIALIGSFLNVHPFGVSVEYIWSYLKNFDPNIDCKYVEDLLCRCLQFRAESRGVGAALTTEWFLQELGCTPKK